MYFTSCIITRGYKKYNKYHFKLQLRVEERNKNLKKESKILISYNRSFSTLRMELCIIADEKDALGQDKKWEWAKQWEETIVNMNWVVWGDGKRWNHFNTWISIVFIFFCSFSFLLHLILIIAEKNSCGVVWNKILLNIFIKFSFERMHTW